MKRYVGGIGPSAVQSWCQLRLLVVALFSFTPRRSNTVKRLKDPVVIGKTRKASLIFIHGINLPPSMSARQV